MAYTVSSTPAKAELGKNQCRFEIWDNRTKIGKLGISKGGLRWTPANAQIAIFKSWDELKDFFESDED